MHNNLAPRFHCLWQIAFRFFYEFLLANDRQVAKEVTTFPYLVLSIIKKISFCLAVFCEIFLSKICIIQSQIRDEYVDTLSKMYYTYFRTYASRLFKLQVSNFI